MIIKSCLAGLKAVVIVYGVEADKQLKRRKTFHLSPISSRELFYPLPLHPDAIIEALPSI